MVQVAESKKSDYIAQLRKDLLLIYPELVTVVQDGSPVVRGTFPVIHEGKVLDRFQIEIRFPEGITKLPEIREIADRIPRVADRHVNPNDGTICVDVPELVLLRGKYDLVGYLKGPVHNFFLSQCCVEQGDGWPFSEWGHGRVGLVQAYGEVLGVSGEKAVTSFLESLTHKKIKGHWPCPCGSGSMIRNCHADELRDLQDKIPAKIARQALKRLLATTGGHAFRRVT